MGHLSDVSASVRDAQIRHEILVGAVLVDGGVVAVGAGQGRGGGRRRRRATKTPSVVQRRLREAQIVGVGVSQGPVKVFACLELEVGAVGMSEGSQNVRVAQFRYELLLSDDAFMSAYLHSDECILQASEQDVALIAVS